MAVLAHHEKMHMRCAFYLGFSLALAISGAAPFGAVAVPTASASARATEPAKTEPAAGLESLSQAAADFRASPSDVSWAEFVKTFKAFMSEPSRVKMDPQSLTRAAPDLRDFGSTVIEAGQARLWTFPKISQAQEAVIVWLETKPASPRKGALPQVVARTQGVVVPAAIQLKEARIIEVRGVAAAKKSGKSVGAAVSAKEKPGGGRYLILIGKDRTAGSVWLRSYKAEPAGFRENLEPLSAIPPFLLNSLSGKAAFNGTEIVLQVHPGGAPLSPPVEGGRAAEVSTYKLALRLVDGRYALEGKVAEDTPYNAVYQFVQALISGRVDLAKAWLLDPKLISIPRYLGLSTKTLQAAPRIINMSSPPSGAVRYRLVTFEKNDLIIDVVRAKNLWAIKAMFIAPSDPVMHRIVKTLPGNVRPADPATAPATEAPKPAKN